MHYLEQLLLLIVNPFWDVERKWLFSCRDKHAMIASGSFKSSLLCHIMGLRPLLPLKCIRNACSFFVTSTQTEDEMELSNSVAVLRKSKDQLREKLKKCESK